MGYWARLRKQLLLSQEALQGQRWKIGMKERSQRHMQGQVLPLATFRAPPLAEPSLLAGQSEAPPHQLQRRGWSRRRNLDGLPCSTSCLSHMSCSCSCGRGQKRAQGQHEEGWRDKGHHE